MRVELVDRGLQLARGFFGEFGEARVVHELRGVDDADTRAAACRLRARRCTATASATDGIELERTVREARVARAEDHERRALDAELGFQGRGDVDLGEDTEALRAERFADRRSVSAIESGTVVSKASMVRPAS